MQDYVSQFRKLFEPGRIGSMDLKNRIVLPPMGTNFADEDGSVTDRMIDHYEARARGGVGLIITEIFCIDSRNGKNLVREASIDNDRYIPRLSQLAEAIKRHGARAAVQLHHSGKEAVALSEGAPLVSSSTVPSYSPYRALTQRPELPPKELSVSEIKDMVTRFAEAARRAKQAGFDGVEIHGGASYIVASFLSAAANTRQDAYGGSLQNRARFLLETLRAIRETVGRDFAVWCRLNALEVGVKGGITVAETVQVAQMAQSAGADAIDVIAFAVPAPPYLPSMAMGFGELLRLAQVIKKSVTVPVISGAKVSPELAEQGLRDGLVDFVYMGRSLIADPDLPNKLATGATNDIRPCLYCDECIGADTRGESLRCSVNAAAGRERQSVIEVSRNPKRVLVVGAGPAGLEAGRVARLRGHEVTLCEKEDRIGGQLNIALRPAYKGHLQVLIDYYGYQLAKLGVTVKMETEATPKMIEHIKPDVIVLATGVRPFIPSIPGISASHVVSAEDVLSEQTETGLRMVVIGGELVGCEVAEYLTERGKQVTVTRRGPEMALQMPSHLRLLMLARLREKGVTLMPGVRYEQVTEQGLGLITNDGQRRTIAADTIVLAAGARPNTDLVAELRQRASEIHVIGDCHQPRRILDAIAEGFEAGMRI